MNTESTNENDLPRSGSGVMSNELIKTLIKNYRTNHLSAINDSLGIQDAHSIWFDLPKLKNFIALIEQEAAKVNPKYAQEDLGIRFYYAAYPKIENWAIMKSHPVPQEYSEKHTLVMVPTMKGKNAEGEFHDFDFNPIQSNKGESVALAARGGSRPSYDDGNLGENSGTLVPPSPIIGEAY